MFAHLNQKVVVCGRDKKTKYILFGNRNTLQGDRNLDSTLNTYWYILHGLEMNFFICQSVLAA